MIQMRKTVENSLLNSVGLPPRDEAAEPQKALMAALTKAPPAVQRRRPQGPCDKCDGPHDTDACPHFKKQRDKHKDAWDRYGNRKNAKDDASDGKKIIQAAQVIAQPGDGSCLFHSLSYGLRSTSASQLRAEIADYIAGNPDALVADNPIKNWVLWDSGLNTAEYARSMRAGSRWGGAVELAVCAKIRGVTVDVYERSGGGFSRISSFQGNSGSCTATVNVLYGGRVHYDALKV